VIHLLHGKDSYRVHAAFIAIRSALETTDGMLESNTSVLDGRTLTPVELQAHVTAVPFLAPHRLVVVEGLLRAVGENTSGRRRKKSETEDAIAPWRPVAAALADPASMPDSTTLVFLEGELTRANAAFPVFAPIARSNEYLPLDRDALLAWLKQETRARGLKLTAGAASRLIELVGTDLWSMTGELDKLQAYAAGDEVDEATVTSLVTPTQRETKFWELTDAIVAGDEAKALTSLSRLLQDGEAPQLLSFMIAAQFRRIAVVKDLADRRAPRSEIAALIDPQKKRDSMINRAIQNAGRYTWAQVEHAYQRLIDADLSVKRGLQDDESALQLLVHELCAVAPRGAARSYAG